MGEMVSPWAGGVLYSAGPYWSWWIELDRCSVLDLACEWRCLGFQVGTSGGCRGLRTG